MDNPSFSLAEALRSQYPEQADMVTDRRTTVNLYPTPFFHRAQIARVLHYGLSHPRGFYAGWIPGASGYILTYRPEAFVELARADEVAIGTAELAVAYCSSYLETTRRMSVLFYLVRSIEDVKLFPNPTPAEQERIDAFLDKYRSVIVPPVVEKTGNRFQVKQFAVREQALEFYRTHVSPEGELQVASDVVASDLPLVYSA